MAKHIVVHQYNDGFGIVIMEKGKTDEHFTYNQEDTAEVVAEVLKYLGHKVTYNPDM